MRGFRQTLAVLLATFLIAPVAEAGGPGATALSKRSSPSPRLHTYQLLLGCMVNPPIGPVCKHMALDFPQMTIEQCERSAIEFLSGPNSTRMDAEGGVIHYSYEGCVRGPTPPEGYVVL